MLLNKSRMDQFMAGSDFDAIIVGKPENAIYLSGFHPMGSRTIRDRLSYVVYFKDVSLSPVALVPSADLRHTREISWIPDENIVGYTEFKTDNDSGLCTDKFGFLAQILADRGLSDSTIGVEMSFLSSNLLGELAHRIPTATLKDCSDLLKHVRMVKTTDEIKRLIQAEYATERACARMIELAATGATEAQIAAEGRATSLLLGAETIGFTMVGSGPRSAFITQQSPSGAREARGRVPVRLRRDCGWLLGRPGQNLCIRCQTHSRTTEVL